MADEAVAPVIASATIASNGTTLTVVFTEAGSQPVLPASGVTGFTLSASGGPVTLSNLSISTVTMIATCSRAIVVGETVTLSYADGNVTDSATTPNALANVSGVAVTNNSAATDTTKPVVASATIGVDGTTLTIVFTEIQSRPILPARGATGLTLLATNGDVRLVDPRISGVTLTAPLSRVVKIGETVTLTYAGTSITDSATSPNAMDAFSGTSVTNNSMMLSDPRRGVAPGAVRRG